MLSNKSDLTELQYNQPSSREETKIPNTPVPILSDLGKKQKTFEEIMAIENGEAELEQEPEYMTYTQRQSGSNVNMSMEQIRDECDEKLANQGFKKLIKVCTIGILCTIAMILSGEFNIYHSVLVGAASVLIFMKMRIFKTLATVSYLTAAIAGIAYILILVSDGFKTDAVFLTNFISTVAATLLGFICFCFEAFGQEVSKYYEYKK